MTAPNMTEDQLHMLVAEFLNNNLPIGSVWHHSPNEGRRHVNYKVKLARMGARAGWPDIEIFVPKFFFRADDWAPIFIELKRPKGGSVSQKQKVVRDELREVGCYWEVCRSVEQVHDYLDGLIFLDPQA